MTDTKIIKEITDLREVNKKVYLMSDGSYKAVYYPQAVHVYDEETESYVEAVNALSNTESTAVTPASSTAGITVSVCEAPNTDSISDITINFPEDLYISGIKKAVLLFDAFSVGGIAEGEKIYVYKGETLTDYFICGTKNIALDITRDIDDYISGRNTDNICLKLCTNESISEDAEIICNPTLAVEYENRIAVNTSGCVHSHSLGRFGTGYIDLISGQLMLESEDISWGGNRMPVSINHLYNSALAKVQYTSGNAAALNIADFSAMTVGKGFKLNLMQSMAAVEDTYIHTDEYGNQTIFTADENGLFKTADSDAVYNSAECVLDFGDEQHTFDTSGRLIKITDGNGNEINITYSEGRLTCVTDGIGRAFNFGYDENGLLVNIISPDETEIGYTYTDGLLTAVTYPDGRKSVISYNGECIPEGITLYELTEDSETGETAENQVYKVCYTPSGNKKIADICEYDADGNIGQSAEYEYYGAAGYTYICAHNEHFIYTYDDDGNPLHEYRLDGDGEKAEIEVSSSDGIDPYLECSGAVVKDSNLLSNHSFASTEKWSVTGGEILTDEAQAKFGKTSLKLYDGGSAEQNVSIEANADYTLSAFVKVTNAFEGGIYLAVKDSEGNVLTKSDTLTDVFCDYQRLSVSFKSDIADIRVCIITEGTIGALICGAQLEKNPFATEYNMAENTNSGLEISGNIEAAQNISFEIPVKSTDSTRESFTLTAWGKAENAFPESERGNAATFRMRAVLTYSDGETEDFTADFNPHNRKWQEVSLNIVKSRFAAVSGIMIYCDYDYNNGVAYFDDIRITRDFIETDLTAEDFEEITATEESETEEQAQDGETPDEFSEVTDEYGNPLTETVFTKGKLGTLYRSFGYSADNGNDLAYETDNSGNTTTYAVDSIHSRNAGIIDRNGIRTYYTYDTAGRIVGIANKTMCNKNLANVNYGYDALDNLTSITRGDGMQYALKYTAFNRPESIGINGIDTPLIQYGYEEKNGRLNSVSYANGDTCELIYNEFGQLSEQKWTNSDTGYESVTGYTYDKDGNIISLIDTASNTRYNYTYGDGNLVSYTEQNGEEFTTVKYVYSEDGTLLKKTVTFPDGAQQVYEFETDEDGNTILKLDNISVISGNDELGRKTFDEVQTGVGAISRAFDYLKGAVSDVHINKKAVKSTPTTQLVSKITFANGRTLEYEYDREERITHIKDSLEGEWEYTYDGLGQLLTEKYKPLDKIYADTVNRMSYDNYGNIKSKNGIFYCYDNTWKDKLIYRGVTNCCDKDHPCRIGSIKYDAQGNPTSYFGNILTWEKGRQLKSFNEIEYTYNANGIRTSKTYGGITHKYILDGTKILREVWEDNTLIPLYDNEDNIYGINYNGVPYFFEKNLQGDIIAITDKYGETIARYSYDAWGMCEIVEDISICNIAEVNPFRYRSYYYDSDIQMYYLQSRYYDPDVGRFINGDEVIMLGSSGILSYGLYTYCNNNAVSLIDPYGKAAYWLTDSKTLGGLGHSSLLVYTNGAWYYFYFGAQNFYKPVNGKAKVVFGSISYSSIFDNGSLNLAKLTQIVKGSHKNFRNENRYKGKKYNRCIKINGNFNSAYNFVNNSVKSTKYNVHKENCAWMCIEVLQRGNISKNEYNELESLQYGSITIYKFFGFGKIVKSTKKYSKIIVPSQVHSEISRIFLHQRLPQPKKI